jgi:hypothetical protein
MRIDEQRRSTSSADRRAAQIDEQRRVRNLAAQLQAVTGRQIVIRDGKAVILQPQAA